MKESATISNNSDYYSYFLLWKPTKYFLILSFLILIVWLFIGPMDWRSVDDYGIFYYFLKKYYFINSNNEFPWNGVMPIPLDNLNPLKLFIQSLNANRGYGTFPHSWSLIYLPLSIPFLKIGLDASRYASLIIGFSSSILISYLVSSLCLTIWISNSNRKNIKNIDNYKSIIQSLSLIFVSLNPEIMIHSATYISYHLPAITVLLFLNIFSSIYLFKFLINSFEIDENEFIKIPRPYAILIFWFSLLLGYQTFIIVLSFIFTFVILQIINKENIFYKVVKNLKHFSLITFVKSNFVPITLSIPLVILSRIHFLRLLFFVTTDSSSGFSMDGNALNYKLNFSELSFFENIKNMFTVFSRLSSLAIYPFREGQNISSVIIFILFLLGSLILLQRSGLSKIIMISIFSTISIALILSLKGNYFLAPTRHNIYLFPCFWIPFIYFLTFSIEKFENFLKVNKAYLIIIPLLIVYITGLNLSNSAIGYSKYQKDRLNNLANMANVFPGSYGQHDLWSLYWTHGNKEWKNVLGKECSVDNQISETNYGFLYGHDEPFKPNDLSQRKYLDEFSNGCIRVKDQIKIIDSFEFYRNTHEEMDGQLSEKQGPKSGLFAYLISK